jgi:hypothetical protein
VDVCKILLGGGNLSVGAHINALQAMSNGQPVPYPATLRVVTHAGRAWRECSLCSRPRVFAARCCSPRQASNLNSVSGFTGGGIYLRWYTRRGLMMRAWQILLATS